MLQLNEQLKVAVDANYKIEAIFTGDPIYFTLSSTGTIYEVPDNFYAAAGDDIRMWDTEWNKLSEIDCITNGYMTLPITQKIVDGVIQEKTLLEKFNDGLFIPPTGYMVTSSGLVEMTPAQSVIAGLITVDVYRTNIVSYFNTSATTAIYKAYPIFAQQNLSNDSTYSANVIAVEMGKTTDFIYAEMYTLISGLVTCSDFVTYRNNIASVDLHSFVAAANSVLQPGLITAYRTVLNSIVCYKLIKFVRTWCNQMIKLALSVNTIEDVQNIQFIDCPNIA